MSSGDLTFALLAANPVGGLFLAVPYGLLRLHYPLWLTLVEGTLLAYLQVVVVDVSWTLLSRSPVWQRFLERRRSPRIEQLLASGGGFWITFGVTPFAGPWLVMSFMCWARVPQRRVALPILLALFATATAVAIASAVPGALVFEAVKKHLCRS